MATNCQNWTWYIFQSTVAPSLWYNQRILEPILFQSFFKALTQMRQASAVAEEPTLNPHWRRSAPQEAGGLTPCLCKPTISLLDWGLFIVADQLLLHSFPAYQPLIAFAWRCQNGPRGTFKSRGSSAIRESRPAKVSILLAGANPRVPACR